MTVYRSGDRPLSTVSPCIKCFVACTTLIVGPDGELVNGRPFGCRTLSKTGYIGNGVRTILRRLHVLKLP